MGKVSFSIDGNRSTMGLGSLNEFLVFLSVLRDQMEPRVLKIRKQF